MNNVAWQGLSTKLSCADYNVRPLDIARCNLVIKALPSCLSESRTHESDAITSSPLSIPSSCEVRVPVSWPWLCLLRWALPQDLMEFILIAVQHYHSPQDSLPLGIYTLIF